MRRRFVLFVLFAGCAVVAASVSAAVESRSHPARRVPKARTRGLVQEKEHRTDLLRDYLKEHSDAQETQNRVEQGSRCTG